MAYITNPFVRRESHDRATIRVYQVFSLLSWLLVVVTGVYYSFQKPHDVPDGHTIWGQAKRYRTPFSQNIFITGIYWVLLLLSQVSYVWHFFSSNNALVTAAANVASHFILNNLFIFAFIMLWVRNYFWPGELIIIAHLLSQSTAYWSNRDAPTFVHLPAVAGPYAWSITALFWNGAVAVGAENTPSRIVANVFIWVIFVIGHLHIFVTKDYLIGYALSFLTLSLAVEQITIKVISLQWIFAFVIFGVFLAGSLYVSTVVYSDRDIFFKRVVHPESTDREREPLLHN
jgi:hypothetical protein